MENTTKLKTKRQKYMIGDHVRYVINRKHFEKGTLAKWSKTVHKIVSNTEHTYKLETELFINIMNFRK